MANIGNKKFDLFKVEKILIGDPSLDLDEAQMDVIDKEFITTNTVQLIKPLPTTSNIDTEGDDNYRTVKDAVDPHQLNFQVYGLELEHYPKFFGGDYDPVNKEWSAPDAQDDIYKSVVVYTGITDSNGAQLKFTFPYANILGGFGGNNLTKNAIESIAVECRANKPVGMNTTKKFIATLVEPVTT